MNGVNLQFKLDSSQQESKEHSFGSHDLPGARFFNTTRAGRIAGSWSSELKEAKLHLAHQCSDRTRWWIPEALNRAPDKRGANYPEHSGRGLLSETVE